MNLFKTFAPLFFLAVSLAFTACSEDTVQTTDGSTLIVTPDTLIFSFTDSVQEAKLELSCGCGFTNIIERIEGDTNNIKVSMLDDHSVVSSSHSLQLRYSPSNVIAPFTPLIIHFKATKGSYQYTNKIVALIAA